MSSLADYADQYKTKKAMTPEQLKHKRELQEVEKQLLEITKRQTENKLLYYKPYAKQREFHKNGAAFTERLLMAANRVGKTMCGGVEIAMHLTGLYPDWWEGRRYDRPVRGWASGVTGESTRDVIQTMLVGTKADGFGTGMIPKDRLDPKKMTLARGVSDLLDTVLVKHISGGWSEIKFKSYERGQEKWQGDTLDFVWFDEEPPMDVYTEGYTRILTTNGFVMLTFTPLQGRSEVVEKFLSGKTKDQAITSMTLDDADHFTPEMRARAIAAWPKYAQEARSRGIPVLGGGRIFETPESQVECDPFEIPKHWSLIWGVDYGIEHPFAAAAHAWDRETDVVYCFHVMKMSDATPLQHAAAMKPLFNNAGGLIPVAWPHDVNQRREFEGDLVPLKNIYKKHGLKMHEKHAQHVDGSNSTEVGILMMDERMKSGRYKVFKNCTLWFEEYRRYHRVDGQIDKVFDDLMSASRQAIMMLRIAKPVLWHNQGGRVVAGTPMAKDVDIDPWAR